MPLGFFFDNARCTGCRTCEMASIDYHDLEVGRRYRRIIDFEGGATTSASDGTVASDCFAYHISVACNHCANPACMGVCPTKAMHRTEWGLVAVDVRRCIGCGYCTIACPYHAPSIDPELKRSSKCDGCEARVVEGLAPVCVEACPLRALDFGEMEDLRAAHPECLQSIMPLPEARYTSPRLLIAASPAAMRARREPGFISNVAEIENNTI